MFCTAVQKAVTEEAETMSALSKTDSKTDSRGECRKFFEEAQPVGMPVDWAKMSDCTAKVIRTPSLIIESTNKIQSNHQ